MVPSQNVSLLGTIIQEKAISYANESNIENFKSLNGWKKQRIWKKHMEKAYGKSKEISSSKNFLENHSVTPEMVNT